MKIRLKHIALEDTRNGDISGGCYGRGKSSGAFVLREGAIKNP